MTSDNAFDLTGRVALVTGGGTGIGAAAAMLLAKYGADVAIAARTVADLEKTAAPVEHATGRRCLIVRTDVKDEEQVVAMVQRTVDELGRIDILVNNAGGTRMGPLENLPTKAWDSVYDLNVRSAYVATREAGVHFRNQGSGAIVNISSDAGIYGVRGGAHYASAKAALRCRCSPPSPPTNGASTASVPTASPSAPSPRNECSKPGTSPVSTKQRSRPERPYAAPAGRMKSLGPSCSRPAMPRPT
jgi:hypothetical protein